MINEKRREWYSLFSEYNMSEPIVLELERSKKISEELKKIIKVNLEWNEKCNLNSECFRHPSRKNLRYKLWKPMDL